MIAMKENAIFKGEIKKTISLQYVGGKSIPSFTIVTDFEYEIEYTFFVRSMQKTWLLPINFFSKNTPKILRRKTISFRKLFKTIIVLYSTENVVDLEMEN